MYSFFFSCCQHLCLLKGIKLDLSSCDTYRPIPLTSILARVFERCLYPRIWQIVASKLDPISIWLSLAVCRSSVLVLLVVLVVLLFLLCFWIFPQPSIVDGMVGLLYKLYKLGVRGHVLRFLASFLSDRSLRVVAQGLFSRWFFSMLVCRRVLYLVLFSFSFSSMISFMLVMIPCLCITMCLLMM